VLFIGVVAAVVVDVGNVKLVASIAGNQPIGLLEKQNVLAEFLHSGSIAFDDRFPVPAESFCGLGNVAFALTDGFDDFKLPSSEWPRLAWFAGPSPFWRLLLAAEVGKVVF
jgi:hypothetical protein